MYHWILGACPFQAFDFRAGRILCRQNSGCIIRIILAAAIVAIFSAPTHADISFYRLFKSIAYDQAADGPPQNGPRGYFGAVDIIASDPDDLTSAVVVSSSVLSPMVLHQTGPGFFSFGNAFATLEELDAGYPNDANFSFSIGGGTLGPQTASLMTPPENLWTLDVPFFTGNAYTELQGIHPNDPFTFAWDGFTPEPGITGTPIFFSLARSADGLQVLGTSANNMPGSIDLPAESLEPNTVYRASLFYSSRIDTPSAGFGTATAEVAFDVTTDLYFTTAALPGEFPTGDYNRNGTVDTADYVLWRETLTQNVPNGTGADGNNDGSITSADYTIWRAHFGETTTGSVLSTVKSAPEAHSIVLIAIAGVAAAHFRYRRNLASALVS